MISSVLLRVVNKSLLPLLQFPSNLVLHLQLGTPSVFGFLPFPFVFDFPSINSTVSSYYKARAKEKVEKITLHWCSYTWLQYSHTVTCAQMLNYLLVLILCSHTSTWISAGSSPQRLSPLGLAIFFQHHLTPGFFLGVQLWTMRNSLCLQWVEVKLTHQCLSPHSNQSLVFRCMEYFPGITTLQI